MKGVSRKLLVLALAALVVPCASAAGDDPVDQPPVVVHRYSVGEIFVYCAGVDCLDAFSEIGGNPWPITDISISSDGGGATSEQFCSALKNKKPQGCDLANPPSTPGTDPNWQPNGCGTSGAGNLVLDAGLEIVASDHYSGDFQAPYPGVSFRSACNEHDACWGAGLVRSDCDTSFHESMRAACGVLTEASSRTVCEGFAGTYFAAVSTTNAGNDNYAAAVSARKCALWAHDMKINGCN